MKLTVSYSTEDNAYVATVTGIRGVVTSAFGATAIDAIRELCNALDAIQLSGTPVDCSDSVSVSDCIVDLPIQPASDMASEPLRCHAAKDGECFWSECPQLRDGEPHRSGRHCPLDTPEDEL